MAKETKAKVAKEKEKVETVEKVEEVVEETPKTVAEVKKKKEPKYPFPIMNIEKVTINGKEYTHVSIQEGNGVTYELSNLPVQYKDLVQSILEK